MDPKGHAAIVTGGASGLGAATARALAAAGAHVAIFDLNEAEGASVASEIGGLFVPCNVAEAESAERAVETAKTAQGPARILVTCAGIAPAGKIVGKNGPMALDTFRRVVEVNLIGTLNLMRLVAGNLEKLSTLAENERGVIVLTASIAAFDGQIGQAAYAASKAGVAGLTLPAAREFASFGIRVCTIAPGIFATPLMAGMPQALQDTLAASVPFPSRFGRPEEFAKLVLHIIDNTMLNGEVIRLDGALRMPPK
ncbi:MAG TPA: SDR family NAD(P)-dependent oxidoreductase [Bryobacteraceae bacterium]|nr:SDR family NAD(P)-dependent oxidoreductase [Bryobacteraceae bacterium]